MLRFYFTLFLKRLPMVLAITALGAAAGFTVASVLPPTYVSYSQLIVEGEQIPQQLAELTVTVAATEQLQIIRQRIMARAGLLDLADRLKIYPPESQFTPDEKVDDMRSRLGFDTTPGQNRPGAPTTATTVVVSFTDENSQRSAQVVNEVVSRVLQEDVEMRTGVSKDTLAFFEQEVQRLDRAVAQASERVLRFKEENRNALPESLDYRRDRQSRLQEELLQLGRDERNLQDRRTRLVDLYQSSGELAYDPANASPQQRQLQSLRDQLATATAVYAPQNPRITMLKNQIAALEATLAGGTAQGGAAATPSAYQVQLTDLDAQLEQIAQEKTRVQKALDDVTATIDATPANAITLGSLDRDFEAARKEYDQAVQRRSQAATGDMIEAMSKGQRITVIEPAVAPQHPNKPNRAFIALAGFGGSLAFAVALAVLLELLNRSIRRPVDITSRLGITPFATLPLIRDPAVVRRRTMRTVTMLAVIVVGVPAALWGLHTYVMPLDELPTALSGVVRRIAS